MSAGLFCTCGKHPPGRTRATEPACPHYAANQATGGQCTSCASGFHEPCAEPLLPDEAIAGECRRCRWHSSDHAHHEPVHHNGFLVGHEDGP